MLGVSSLLSDCFRTVICLCRGVFIMRIYNNLVLSHLLLSLSLQNHFREHQALSSKLPKMRRSAPPGIMPAGKRAREALKNWLRST
jgi:hypothetical protein